MLARIARETRRDQRRRRWRTVGCEQIAGPPVGGGRRGRRAHRRGGARTVRRVRHGPMADGGRRHSDRRRRPGLGGTASNGGCGGRGAGAGAIARRAAAVSVRIPGPVRRRGIPGGRISRGGLARRSEVRADHAAVELRRRVGAYVHRQPGGARLAAAARVHRRGGLRTVAGRPLHRRTRRLHRRPRAERAAASSGAPGRAGARRDRGAGRDRTGPA